MGVVAERERSAGQAATLRANLGAVAQANGYCGALYIHFGHVLTPRGVQIGIDPRHAEPRYLAATAGFDEARYRERNYIRVDPLAWRSRQSMAPFVWRLDDLRNGPPGSDAFFDAMSDWGMEAGVATPIQDYAAGPAMLTLFGRVGRGAVRRPDLATVLEAAGHIHRLADAERSSAAACLSAREMDVLRLAATGMTEAQTAQMLALSRRGVQFHIGRAMEKLEAPNKTAAVARAVSLGLIRV